MATEPVALTVTPPSPAGKAPRQPMFVVGESRQPGRPGYLTQEVEQRFMTALRSGNSIADSARYAGLKPTTVEQWLRRGRGQMKDRPNKPDYIRFARLTDESRATARVYVIGNLVARTRVDTRAAEVWLRVHGGDEWRGAPPELPAGGTAVNIDARQQQIVLLPPDHADRLVEGLLAQRRATYSDPPIIDQEDVTPRGLSRTARAGLREDG